MPIAAPSSSGRALSWALLTVLCLLTASPAYAQWAWRDANGRITASDRPPPRDVADKDIISRPKSEKRRAESAAAPASAAQAASTPAAAAAPVKTSLERDVEARKAKEEQEQAAKKKADEAKLAAQRADNCQRAKQQIASLDSGIRIARVGVNGEREVLDDAGRAGEAKRAREVISSDCK
jgi:type IV secretory pathway VirB10-like protein